MGELGEAAGWQAVGLGGTRKEEKMEKWKLWRGAIRVEMAEPTEKAGPKEEQKGKR